MLALENCGQRVVACGAMLDCLFSRTADRAARAASMLTLKNCGQRVACGAMLVLENRGQRGEAADMLAVETKSSAGVKLLVASCGRLKLRHSVEQVECSGAFTSCFEDGAFMSFWSWRRPRFPWR
jgi:hypothetical protein